MTRRPPILIIGEAPGKETNDGPLEGAVGKRLAEYAGLSWDEYLALTERRNLFAHPVDPWPSTEARTHAAMVWETLLGRRTILLGQRVAKAFSLTWTTLSWARLDDRGTEVAIIPHPSGQNLWWNEAGNRAAARRFLHDAFGVE